MARSRSIQVSDSAAETAESALRLPALSAQHVFGSDLRQAQDHAGVTQVLLNSWIVAESKTPAFRHTFSYLSVGSRSLECLISPREGSCLADSPGYSCGGVPQVCPSARTACAPGAQGLQRCSGFEVALGFSGGLPQRRHFFDALTVRSSFFARRRHASEQYGDARMSRRTSAILLRHTVQYLTNFGSAAVIASPLPCGRSMPLRDGHAAPPWVSSHR